MLPFLQSFAFWFGLFVDIVGAVVLVSRIILKLLPRPVKIDGRYSRFVQTLLHLSLSLGHLESEI